jgi:broad specificity phosphatase PhoE
VAVKIGDYSRQQRFAQVLTSPLQRTHQPCRLAGYGEVATTDGDLIEWDYGEYGGRSTPDIRAQNPGWSLWVHGAAGGEAISDVASRSQAVIERWTAASDPALLLGHGHLLRVLTACWLGLEPAAGRLFALSKASVSISDWNVRPG